MIPANKLPQNTVTYGQMNLIFQSRALWRELVTWSRIYLDSRIAGIGTMEDVFKRIYSIPEEFGNVIRIVFGDQAAEIIVQQLTNTVMLYRQLVEAMVTGNQDATNKIAQELYKNGDERAEYMASINPYWDEARWKDLLYTFYAYSFQEIISILTNDPKNVDQFDRFLKFTDIMGDYFAQGLFDYITNKPQNKTV